MRETVCLAGMVSVDLGRSPIVRSRAVFEHLAASGYVKLWRVFAASAGGQAVEV